MPEPPTPSGSTDPPHSPLGRSVSSPRDRAFSSPYDILTDAIKAVPSLKYALGVLGIVAAIAIVNAFRIDYRVAILGALVMFALMVLLLVFAKLTKAASKQFRVPVVVLMWTFLLLTTGTASLLFTSVFFKVPLDLQYWIKPEPQGHLGGKMSLADISTVLERGAPPLPGSTSAPPELGVEVVALRAGTDAFVILSDGTELASEVDDYFIVARTLTSGYLYVFQLDSTGHLQWLFPSNDTSRHSSGNNPVRAESTVTVPEGSGRALFLDSTTGAESIYAVFSVTRWPDLESALRDASARHTQGGGTRRELLSGNRGVGGVRRAPDSASVSRAVVTHIEGKPYVLPAPVEVVLASGHFVVVKRWFRHLASR